jgi:hypothetical protein
MPQGKAAGERCVQLDGANRCRLFGHASRPAVCAGLQASVDMCGPDAAAATVFLTSLERLTAPSPRDARDGQ